MYRPIELERLKEEHSFKFKESWKDELYKIMLYHAETEYRLSEPFFIELTMKYRMKVSDKLLNEYDTWLKGSPYYEVTKFYTGDTVSPYDQFGKLKMFKEFLLDYKGEV